jgi:hypothetical protein
MSTLNKRYVIVNRRGEKIIAKATISTRKDACRYCLLHNAYCILSWDCRTGITGKVRILERDYNETPAKFKSKELHVEWFNKNRPKIERI